MCIRDRVYPDRRPHTGLLEFKNVYRPARVVKYDQESGMLTLHNYMDFVDLTEYAALTYQVSCDGEVIDNGFIPVSYTHLDVYKRQVPRCKPPRIRPCHGICCWL